MARKRRTGKIFFLIILGVLIWLGSRYYEHISPYFSETFTYIRTYFEPEPRVRVIESEVSLKENLPAGFPLKNLKEKELDLDRDGRKEILFTSFEGNKPRAVLVDAESPEQKLSQIFDFSTQEFSAEVEVKPGDAPELSQTIDLNDDGIEEIILDLEDYGAYTESFGVLSFQDGNLAWVILKGASGDTRPAIFRDGSSVKHSNVFRILEEGGRALVQIIGEKDAAGNWFWEVETFRWDGVSYAYDAALSEKILKEQPRRFDNGEPIFE